MRFMRKFRKNEMFLQNKYYPNDSDSKLIVSVGYVCWIWIKAVVAMDIYSIVSTYEHYNVK